MAAKFCAIAVSVALSLLASCAAVRDATRSFVDFSNPVETINIRPEGPPAAIEYRPGLRCTFSRTAVIDGRRAPEYLFDIETRAVRDRILITHRKQEGLSSILLSRFGQPLDWNVPTRQGGRASPQSDASSAFWIDAPTFLHPNFGSRPGFPGTFYGQIQGPDGRLVAQLLYRGRTFFSHRPALVFDVMSPERSTGMRNGAPIGRLVLDEQDSLPHALVMGFNRRIQYERRTCSGY